MMHDILLQAALAGSSVIMKYFKSDLKTNQKTSHHDIVTIADTEAQSTIYKALIEESLKHGLKANQIGFAGEEAGENRVAEYTFVVDPIDGTSNFAAGWEMFTISIAVVQKGKTIAAILYDPPKSTYYYAELGRGAYKIKGGKKQKLEIVYRPPSELLFSAINTNDPARRKTLNELHGKLSELFRENRLIGSITIEAIMLVTNVIGFKISYGPRVWDIAAAKLIIEEAGGVMLEWDGQDFDFDLTKPDKPYRSLACHPKNLSLILEALH